MSNIEETLKKIAAGTSKASSPTSSTTSEARPARKTSLAGEQDCPLCGGLGYLRADLPVDDPDFGKIQVCSCREGQIGRQIRQRLFALSNLDELAHLTFDNFQPRGKVGLTPLQSDTLEHAYNHSQQYAQSLKGWLLLQGGYGCGKTHLAAAIANQAVSLGVPTLFITVPDLLDMLRHAYNDPDATFEQRFEEIRTARLLVMDDFGTQNATPWAQEKLFQILNYRYINRLPLIVTTNLIMDDIEGRIRSRLEDPELVTHVHILAPDYRRPMEDTSHSDLSSLSMHSHQKFSNFEDRRGEGLTAEELRNLEGAVQAALEFANNPRGWLVLIGPHASGKTHLAAAIANYQAEMGKNPVLVSVIDLLDHLRSTFSPNSSVRYDRRFDEVREADLLVLDGLGTQSSTPWGREKLFQLFDFRYNAKLPTIITMVNSVDDLNNTEPGLASRMLDRRLCRIYGMIVPPYRGVSAPARPKRSTTRRSRE